MEQVCKNAKALFPELNVQVSDISDPTEAFLTRALVHCLRAFGFRVEPPYNVDSEANDTSKAKRVFIGKLCRQTQRILQISFPSMTYSYYDIIAPTPKKTLNTLDVLCNYYCFYKMHKKEVIPPIMERHLERQSLIAVIAANKRELEQRKQREVQDTTDIAKCEANIKKLQAELPKAESELNKQSKTLRQLQSELATQEEQQSELRNQVNHLQQLVVLESDMTALQMEAKELAAQIEKHKPEKAKLDQIYNERRLEIEKISRLNDEIEKAFNILPPDVLNDYKEELKQKESLEKSHVELMHKLQGLQDMNVKSQKVLAQVEEKYKARKLQCEQEASKLLEKVAEQEALKEQQTGKIEQLEQCIKTLEEKLDEEQRVAEDLKIFVTKLFGEQEDLS
ncbi:hypothetical protein ACLKA6_013839 [Drosophila palustris]